MAKTRHPSWLLILTYTIMGFAWAGKSQLSALEMLVSAGACLILGFVVVTAEYGFKLPVYVARFLGVSIASAIVFLLSPYIPYPKGALNVIVVMILPTAAGAMLVEGLCTSHTKQGKKKIWGAILCSIALGLGVFLSAHYIGGVSVCLQ